MEKKLELDLIDQQKTSVVLVSPEGPTSRAVLLCHGFMSSKESSTNRTLTPRLLSKRIAACRFDLFGHGDSDGPFSRLTLTQCLEQTEAMLGWLRENGYTEIGLVGSSFGGLIAIHTAAKHPELIAVALKCPVSDYPPIWRTHLGETGMNHWKESGLLAIATPNGKARLEYTFYEDLLKYDTYRAAAQIKSPTLIVHGEADEYVPFDQSLRLFDTLRLPNDQREMEPIPGANHEFSKPEDFEKMATRIERWIVDHLLDMKTT
ncbi:MAG: alpha/beta fold hydrolase [Candidatus Manganitrophaceae bacterium]|nr:MAG: alpha/beta fold hydrolase [Candidatus Manganitrophaceae bacterium]